MQPRADLLIVCPRCGLGNRLRATVSAMHFAQQHELRLAHLWRRDSPVGSTFLFGNERRGAGRCDLETLFEPVRSCAAFVDEGQTVRLLYEHPDMYQYDGLNVVDERHYPGNSFDHERSISEAQLAGVDAVLVLTSLNMPIERAQKAALYQQLFRPRTQYLEIIEARTELSQGRWLCVHLRTNIRKYYGVVDWSQQEVADATRKLLAQHPFDQIIVFSDSLEAKKAFMQHRFDGMPVCSLDWGTEDYVENMFLDFLAISKAQFVLNSGLSSFSQEAAIFGGGVPHYDLFRDRLDD